MTSFRIISNDTLVLFAELQRGIANLPLTVKPAKLKKGVLALGKLAKLFDLPVIVTAVAEDGSPKIMPEIEEGYGKVPTHTRKTADSFLNKTIAETIQKSGRGTILRRCRHRASCAIACVDRSGFGLPDICSS
ncbi:hypothetical protein [Tunturiibacter psychrotolerans]|uniref:hypothetical protein n=1 Tax=Tunturiibacter psychrotolerans TaxID=3069686 RepID=UPI003D25D743